MFNNQTLQSLRSLKLTGMADALEQQLEQPATHDDLSFIERLSLLVDREACSRSNTRVARLLKTAQLKIQAQPDDVNYRHPKKALSQPYYPGNGSRGIRMSFSLDPPAVERRILVVCWQHRPAVKGTRYATSAPHAYSKHSR